MAHFIAGSGSRTKRSHIKVKDRRRESAATPDPEAGKHVKMHGADGAVMKHKYRLPLMRGVCAFT